MGMKVLQVAPGAGKVQLDAYDRKILFVMAQNCRTPTSQIAKKVGLSRDAVRYRIANLEKSGVVQGYRALVNITRLGFLNVHLLLQLNQPQPEAEKRIVEKFKAYPFVRAIIKFSGKYDFELAVIAKDLNDLEGIVSRVIEDCGEYLQDYNILFLTKTFSAKTFPDNFLKAPEHAKPIEYEEPKLDQTDYKLLSIIADNACMPLQHIAHKLGISADTVKYRMKRLKQSGVIAGFVPVINYDLVDYNVYAILLSISGFSEKKEATLKEFLRTNKDILWGVKTIGKYNVLLYICTSNPDDLVKTTAELRSYFTQAVRDYETLINYEEYTYTYFPEVARKMH